jgi:hypothetical protein
MNSTLSSCGHSGLNNGRKVVYKSKNIQVQIIEYQVNGMNLVPDCLYFMNVYCPEKTVHTQKEAICQKI